MSLKYRINTAKKHIKIVDFLKRIMEKRDVIFVPSSNCSDANRKDQTSAILANSQCNEGELVGQIQVFLIYYQQYIENLSKWRTSDFIYCYKSNSAFWSWFRETSQVCNYGYMLKSIIHSSK